MVPEATGLPSTASEVSRNVIVSPAFSYRDSCSFRCANPLQSFIKLDFHPTGARPRVIPAAPLRGLPGLEDSTRSGSPAPGQASDRIHRRAIQQPRVFVQNQNTRPRVPDGAILCPPGWTARRREGEVESTESLPL